MFFICTFTFFQIYLPWHEKNVDYQKYLASNGVLEFIWELRVLVLFLKN